MIAVSVIIPIYNVQNYIQQSLLSATGQTLRNIEIICIDDGSTDDSMSFVETLAAKDNRIRILYKENGGASSARNVGLDIAQGKYICFLDSDDYLLPDALEILYSHAQKNNLDSLCFNAQCFFETTELAQRFSNYNEYYNRRHSYDDVYTGQELLSLMVKNNDWCASDWLQFTRRTLLNDFNIRFKEGIIHEDDLFTMQVSLYAKSAAHLPKILYQRRIREGSVMTSRSAVHSCISYYRCLTAIQPAILAQVTDPELLEAYLMQLDKWQRGAARPLTTLSKEEFSALTYGETFEEQIHFELTVKSFAYRLRQREQTNLRTKKQIAEVQDSYSMKVGRKISHLAGRK